jgi:hypothetical protein
MTTESQIYRIDGRAGELWFTIHCEYRIKTVYRWPLDTGARMFADAPCTQAVASLQPSLVTDGFVLDPRKTWLAYARVGDPATLVVHDIGDDTTRELGQGHPVAVSPDGSELLVYAGTWVAGARPLSAVSVADGTKRTLAEVPSRGDPAAFFWGAAGPELALTGRHENAVVVAQLETGRSNQVWQSEDRPWHLAWSDDGRILAFWAVTLGGWTGSDIVGTTELIALDRETGATKEIVSTKVEDFGDIAIDASSTYIAYVIEGAAYYKKLRL